MIRKQPLPELLAPAGDFDALIAALLGGADAVYVGGRRFGARAFAKNFDDEEMARAARACHLFGARLYVTVNTLVFDKEMNEAVEYVKRLHGMGVDAVIVADLGLLSRLGREVPGLELHASTQMGIHNLAGAEEAYRLGCSRVVLARECSAEDIGTVTERCSAEVEMFVHGALCVCHSGQCLFSSMVGGRSGNRGECAQPCRLPYDKGSYVLSLTDLSLASHVRRLISLGVSTLKIEGRMKSPSYVYEVTGIYRTLLDECRPANAAESPRLSDVFSRGGFTDGYFTGRYTRKMTGVRSEADKDASRAIGEVKLELPRVAISAHASFKLGVPAALSFSLSAPSRWDRGESFTVSAFALGECPEAAQNAPLSASDVCARLSKLGATPFSLSASDIELELDEGINLSPARINELRRECAAALNMALAKKLDVLLGFGEKMPPRAQLCADETACDDGREILAKEKLRTALFLCADKYREIEGNYPECLCGIDIVFLPLFELLNTGAVPSGVGAYLPPVIMESEWGSVYGALSLAREAGLRYCLAGNISHATLARECGVTPIGDFRLNIANGEAKRAYASLGITRPVLSAELTLPMARDIGGGVITLGRIPLMLTERCFIKENYGCDACGKACLTDRKGQRFPLLREWQHRNLIMNSQPTYMGDKRDELLRAHIGHEHFIFSSESVGEIEALLGAYKSGTPWDKPHRRIGKR